MSALSKPASTGPKLRDPRLDFFRGLGMFIILMAHIPGNSFADWLPRRFGFSDAADMFVFCSGMASALAFARIFDNFGWFIGTARIVYRIWQVYWAHIGSFMVVVAVVVMIDNALGTMDYEHQLGVDTIFAMSRTHIYGLMTLTYLPNYFDILPMYLVMLALIPVVLGLEKMHRAVILVVVCTFWLGANFFHLHFVADVADGREWFFNPFGWQLVFLSGFSLVRGWLPIPKVRAGFIGLAVVIVLLAVPLSFPMDYSGLGPLERWHEALVFWTDKTNVGLARYVHFMATVYLAYVAAGERGANLRGPIVDVIRQVGQQTLAVFLTGLLAAQVLGVGFRFVGTGFWATALINVFGIVALIATAKIVHWFKVPPWQKAVKFTPV